MSTYRHDPYSAAAYVLVLPPQPVYRATPEVSPVLCPANTRRSNVVSPIPAADFSDSESFHLTETTDSEKSDSFRCESPSTTATKATPQPKGRRTPSEKPEGDQIVQLVQSLSLERVDNVIERRVRGITVELCRRAVAHIANDAALLEKLCMVDRGNVVFQLMKRLRGDYCGLLVAFGVKNFLRLALHQSGCIALSRMIESACTADRAQLVGLCVRHFFQLAPHQYGNYTVQAALSVADDGTLSQLGLMMSEVDAVLGLTGSKFGSHVVEKFVKTAPIAHVTGVVQSALGCTATLHHLAHDRFANYVLQAMLGALAAHNRQLPQPLLQWVGERVSTQLGSTPHSPNLRKRLALLFK